MKEVYRQFQQELREEGKSIQTIRTYCTDVRLAFETQSITSIGMKRLEVVHYMEWLEQKGYRPTTINKKVNSLKVYHDFLLKHDMWQEQPIRLKQDRVKVASGSEHTVEALTDEEVERVLEEVKKPQYNERDRLIVYVLLYTAVRVSELVQMKWTDIDFLTQTVVVRGKGGKVREVGLRSDVIEQLNRYQLEERASSRFADSPYVFISERAANIHRDTVRRTLKSLGESVQLHLYPHLFRRTCATLLLKRGVPIVTVSKILGHHSVDMTSQMYIHTSREDKQTALELL